jgi:hypothetical protein
MIDDLSRSLRAILGAQGRALANLARPAQRGNRKPDRPWQGPGLTTCATDVS